MKRVLALVLMLAFLLSLAACSGAENGAEATEFVRKLKIGWNLGNTLDATGRGHNAETAWGNPKTTEDMILDVKAMGFNTVRIPVSWGGHCDSEGLVDEAWMARVHEVVDYAYKNGMYVILNSHHDTDYYDIGSSLTSEKIREFCLNRMTVLWAQIAEEFKDYDERLIFETLNEPRTVGSEKEWSGGTPEEREIIYTLNEEIVKTVRSTGGRNKTRYIMVPSYGATSDLSVLSEMQLPDDDRIIVSVHAYAPYDFAMNAEGPAEFTESHRKELDGFFKGLNELFVCCGIPVVLGEFGVTNKDNPEDRLAWAEYYVQGAKQYGIPCIVWDNNQASGVGAEMFGLYNRREGTWYFPELAEAYVRAAEQEE